MKRKIVTIGGGSGQYVLLSGLRDLKDIEISAIVSMFDSGGSTGRLRDELGILPPGDILKCVLALSPYRDVAREILSFNRFNGDNRLKGHNAGNMLLTILSQYAGNFPDGVKALGEMLRAKGEVLPVTINKATLVAELTDGSFLYGEAAIDVPRGNQRERIKRTFLVPHYQDGIKVYPPVIKAIEEADYIIAGPGDFYTSIISNSLVPGVKEAIREAGAKLIYVVNIMTKFGETHGWNGADFVRNLEKAIGRKANVVIFNSSKPDKEVLEQYDQQKAYLVACGRRSDIGRERIIIKADIAGFTGGLVRHDSDKLAQLIKEIIFKN